MKRLLIAALIPLQGLFAQGPPLLLRSQPAMPHGEVIALGLTALAAVSVIPLDQRISVWMLDPAHHQNGAANAVAAGARLYGEPGTIVLSAALWGGGALARNNTAATDGARALEAVAIGEVITILVKGITGRARPSASPSNAGSFAWFKGFSDETRRSFPSGHATAAFAVASALTARASLRSSSSAQVIGPLLYSAATLASASRVYHNAHWFSDVIMSAGIGTVTGLLLVRQIDRK